MELTDIHILALSRLFDSRCKQSKEARQEIEPGEYDIDMTVRVQGSLSVGEDYSQEIVAKADPWALLAVALDKLNGTTVEALVRDSGEIAKAEVVKVKEQTKAAMEALKGRTETDCKGKVQASLTATPMGKTLVSSNRTGPKKQPTQLVVVKNTKKTKKKVPKQGDAAQVSMF